MLVIKYSKVTGPIYYSESERKYLILMGDTTVKVKEARLIYDEDHHQSEAVSVFLKEGCNPEPLYSSIRELRHKYYPTKTVLQVQILALENMSRIFGWLAMHNTEAKHPGGDWQALDAKTNRRFWKYVQILIDHGKVSKAHGTA